MPADNKHLGVFDINVFDIIGPVMIGPSSSHTAGAAKIGKIARTLLGEDPSEAVIKLHGSFAKTYVGHGTDKAIVGGLLGMLPDDPGIRESLKIASEIGIIIKFEQIDLKDAHPNTAVIEAKGKSGEKVAITGSSIGGGNIIVKQINGMCVEFTGQYHTLVIPHKDVPGAIAAVASMLAYNTVNIASMKVYRSIRGGDAIMILETDQPVDIKLASLLKQLPHNKDVKIVGPL